MKGFQEYLGGAFVDLAQSVESLELVRLMVVQPSPLDQQAADLLREAATPALRPLLPTPSAPMKT